MTVAGYTYGIDSGTPNIDANAAKAAGSQFHLRYSAGQASLPGNSSNARNQWKLVRPGEINSIVASGQLFGANDEWYTSRPTEGGGAGHADGAAAKQFWQSRGLPAGFGIVLSWDEAPNSGKYGAVADYIAGFQSAVAGTYVARGFYAGIPAMGEMARRGLIDWGWVPEASSWSGLPGWYYQPTDAQLPGCFNDVKARCEQAGLKAAIWQNGNKWFGNQADENVLLYGDLRSAFGFVGGSAPTPPTPTPTPPSGGATGPHNGRGWPSYMPSGHYFGLITGPKKSHGGYYAAEKPDVKAIQQQLIWAGYVPGQTNINSGWADGIFEQPTADAVTRFQHAHMPGTQYYGQCWSDDWSKLMHLTK
jgi:hypothetical protein